MEAEHEERLSIIDPKKLKPGRPLGADAPTLSINHRNWTLYNHRGHDRHGRLSSQERISANGINADGRERRARAVS